MSNRQANTEASKREADSKPESSDFIREIISKDLQQGMDEGKIVTRFPPEPNGYLHIGHAKAICLNFGISEENTGAVCHLRFDDTNPAKEETEYVDSIKEDVKWLGFEFGEKEFYASDYFDRLHEYAVQLIRDGKAFVCDLTKGEIAEYRGTPTVPGKNSPNRERSVEENLTLFDKMKNGEFADGEKTLRAKIDMSSPNMHMRDPAIYRIRKTLHHRTGDKWVIYPMYDFTHCLSDAIEGITHSLCTLEFEVHRPLYDWVLDHLSTPSRPRQIEFARLNLSYTALSKRKLLQLVENGDVSGWNDPRMPTLSGLRRRGYTPESIRKFCTQIGVTKFNSVTDLARLEHSLREDLNKSAHRVMAVLKPVKLILTNYPEDQVEEMEAVNNPEDPDAGTRLLPFSRELFIERDDFMEDPPKKFFRLAPGREVRLRYGYIIQCNAVVKNPDTGEIEELHCTYDPETKSGSGKPTRKVKGTIHWVSVQHSIPAEVRLYDRLFTKENPTDEKDGTVFTEHLNSDSLAILSKCRIEPSMKGALPGARFQFERIGYFCVDSIDSTPDQLVINRTVTLRDAWAKRKR
jgi:glutaminyl-tRNA synthetase